MSETSALYFGMGIGVMIGWFWFGNGYKTVEKTIDDWIWSVQWLVKKAKRLQMKVIEN